MTNPDNTKALVSAAVARAEIELEDCTDADYALFQCQHGIQDYYQAEDVLEFLDRPSAKRSKATVAPVSED